MCEVLEPGEHFKVKQPQLSWDDIAGFSELKERLEEMVSLPLKHPQSFKKAGIKPHAGVLIWGPSNSGYNTLAEAAAKSAESNYISSKAAELLKHEGTIQMLFDTAVELAPCVLFIGDIEELAPRREVASEDGKWAPTEVTRQLFAEIDKVAGRGDVIIIGATQHPELVDPALLRNGRIDRKIYVPAPDYYDRLEIIKASLKETPLHEDVKMEELAEMTEYYSASDILSFTREATLFAIKDKKGNFEAVGLKNFKDAMGKVPPSL
ncbi:MAG: AAA family ATPase, partial [Candidatus Hydrothermarchaeales archaeon]